MSSAEECVVIVEDGANEITDNDTNEQEVSPSEEDAVDAMSPTNKMKYATVDIYRPPSVRSGDGASSSLKSRLNVHAKEFVMVAEQRTKGDGDSESPTDEDTSSTDAKPFEPNPLNKSKSRTSAFNDIKLITSQNQTNVSQKNFYLQKVKSSGDIDLMLDSQKAAFDETERGAFDFLRVKSSRSAPREKLRKVAMVSTAIAEDAVDSLETDPPKMPVLEPVGGSKGSTISISTPENAVDSLRTEKTSPPKIPALEPLVGSLQRSQSLSAKDTFKIVELEALPPKSFTEYDLFPEKLHKLIKSAIERTNRVEEQGKIALARKVVEETVDNGKLASAAAKLSVIIIDKDKVGAYCDSLLNTCQMLYQKKAEGTLSQPDKLVAFLNFLQELHTELKRYKVHYGWSESCETIILNLIASSCMDIVKNSGSHSVREIECLYQALTKVGRYIENAAPQMFKRTFDTLREVLVAGLRGSEIRPEIRKVFLQMLELRAFEWQLPLSALNFYHPKVL